MTQRARRRHRRVHEEAQQDPSRARGARGGDRDPDPELRDLGAQRGGRGTSDRRAEADRQGRELADLRRRRDPARIHPARTRAGPRSRSTTSPRTMQEATVAIEDERFYEHSGVDSNAIVRAAIENVEAGKTVQGGSTITQQLVRNLYIADPERDLERKIREAKLAEELEEEHSKQWILEQYLNTASYGTIDGRTVDRRRGRRPDLLQQAGQGPEPDRGGAARGPAAVAVAIQPVPRPQRGAGAPQRGARRDGRAGLHQPDRGRRGGQPRALGPRPRLQVPRDQRALLLRLRRAGADRPLRRQHRAPGRAQGLHLDPARPPGRRAPGDRQTRLRLRPDRRGGVSIDVNNGPHRRARLVAQLPARATSTSPPQGHRQPGLLVQGVRAHRGAAPGHRPLLDDLHVAATSTSTCPSTATGWSTRPRAASATAR